MSDPEQDVRRLLAAARDSEPLPPPVAQRLDDVLAELERSRASVPESSGAGPGTGVRRLSRPRRAAWTAAAAAVVLVVAGLAGGSLGRVLHGPTGQDSAATADSTAAEERTPGPGEVPGPTAQGDGEAPGPRTGAGGGATREQPDSLADAPSRGDVRPEMVLDPASLTEDLLRAQAAGPSSGVLGRLAVAGCLPGAAGPRDQLLEVRYDDRPAVLVLRPATAAGQKAIVQVCGDEDPVRRVLLPPPG